MIVPVYNEESTIEVCLRALENQTISRDQYEVIVIDDGSTDRTSELIRAFPKVRYLQQAHKGPASARNLGAQQANGRFLVFTDGDCVAQYDWLEQIVAPLLKDAEVIGVKGAYRTHQQEIAARFVQLEYEDRYDLMQRDRYIDFIDTYAAAYRRAVFLASGGFDTSFPTAMGEDTELSYRLAQAGYKMVFNPRAIVYHYHPSSVRAYLRRKYTAAYWRVVLYRLHPAKFKRDSHTPQVVKLQALLAAGWLCAMFGATCAQWFIYPLFVLTILLLSSFLPFTFKAITKDPLVGLLSPIILFLRSFAYLFGIVGGVFHLISKAEGPKLAEDGL